MEHDKTYRKKDISEEYQKKVPKGETLPVFKICLGKLRSKFLKKYDARNQKAHMRVGLVKPRGLLVDSISSRL